MCGIAGLIDLTGRRPVPPEVLGRMAEALVHRGPDEDGFLEQPGLGLASRRLSIVGLADGRQPIGNEGGDVVVVFNGEVFDHPELRAELEGRGHVFRTRCDTEVLPHLYEESGEAMLPRLRGQFALALWDARRRRLLLARDRFGICPLFWTRQVTPEGEWLLFASEIKALLASGLVPARADERGIDQIFTFFALPGPETCFAGVQMLRPGRCLGVEAGRVVERSFWEPDFPERGRETGGEVGRLAGEYEALLVRAVGRRLRADVPVAAYLSGGVDSSLVMAVASRLLGRPIPTFTIQVRAPGLDETHKAEATARHAGSESVIVPCGAEEILGAYPRLICAAEAPVNDTCCAALLLLAQEVHAHGYKVVLTGEGADETLAGYPWFKVQCLLGLLGGVAGGWGRRAFYRWVGGRDFDPVRLRDAAEAVGAQTAWHDLYGLVGLARGMFYGERLRGLDGYQPFAGLGIDPDRLRRWHPLNQSLAVGQRTHLPGLLLSLGGDRVAMHSSVETRYPFLDEDLADFAAGLKPNLKLRGLQEKYLMRRVAERWLPRAIAWRPKTMFQAPFDLFCRRPAPAWVGQLLSPESLRRTGYFDVGRVRHWLRAVQGLRPGSPRRFVIELGLGAVAATQLWHQTFIDASLADVPGGGADRLASRMEV